MSSILDACAETLDTAQKEALYNRFLKETGELQHTVLYDTPEVNEWLWIFENKAKIMRCTKLINLIG